MGGAGLYSMAVSVITEITPLHYIGVSSGLLGSIFAMSSLLGPTLGGAITSHTTWRWVFWLKYACSSFFAAASGKHTDVCVKASHLASLPSWPWLSCSREMHAQMKITRRHFAMMDYVGMISYLIGSTMLVFALEEGGLVYAWHSPVIIVTFSLSAAAFVFFMAPVGYIETYRIGLVFVPDVPD